MENNKVASDIENIVLQRAMHMMNENRTWRYGQCLFNALYEIYPDMADKIRGGSYDPFYNDNRATNFFAAITLLNSGIDVQGSDTTGDAQSGAAKDKNPSNSINNSPEQWKELETRVDFFINQNRRICWEAEYEHGEYCIGEEKVKSFFLPIIQSLQEKIKKLEGSQRQ